MNSPLELTEEQLERYARQILVTNFGGRAQKRLLHTQIAVYGTGPLTERLALGLARCGAGCIHVAESVAPKIAPQVGPDTRVVPHREPSECFDASALCIDGGLTPEDWHRCVEPAARVHNFALWSRTLGSMGLVGVTASEEPAQLCVGWYFDLLERPTSPSVYEPYAIEWCAAWTSALALRHVANPHAVKGSILYRYDVESGKVDEFLVPENFRCEHRNCE